MAAVIITAIGKLSSYRSSSSVGHLASFHLCDQVEPATLNNFLGEQETATQSPAEQANEASVQK
jgi:hypothetical protein